MKAARVLVVLLGVLLLPCAEIQGQQSRRQGNRIANSIAADTSARFYPEKLAEIDAVIEQNISSNKLPGGVLWLERDGVVYKRAY